MSIYGELRQDHQKVKQLLAQLSELSDRATKRKASLFAELKAMVVAHARAEEKVFYDAIKGDKDGKDEALEGYEEHHIVDVLFKEMSRLEPSDEKWKAKLKVLQESLEHHIEEEEGEIFETAEGILSDEEAEEIGGRFVAEKAKRRSKAA